MLDDLDLAQRAPHYDFLALMRAIECSRPALPRLGRALQLADEALRLGQDPELAFAAAALSRFYPENGGKPARLAVALPGLIGPQGPMPLAFSEYVFNRAVQCGDSSWRAFLDLFNHRLYCLYYRAWAAAQPAVAADRPADDPFAGHLASVCGIAAPPPEAKDDWHKAQLHFAALLANQRRPATGLETLLRAYFKLPLRIEPFAGEYLPLADQECTRLGRVRTPLGHGIALGTRVWSASHRFRLVFGPLSYTDFRRLLPEGASLAALARWVGFYTAGQLDWQLELRLAADAWRPTRLGSDTQLGRTSWLGRPALPRLRFSPSKYQARNSHHG